MHTLFQLTQEETNTIYKKHFPFAEYEKKLNKCFEMINKQNKLIEKLQQEIDSVKARLENTEKAQTVQPKPTQADIKPAPIIQPQAVFLKEEVVNNRKDEPIVGIWTCPNCGKIMPNYVGTCGCGEPKPFGFAPPMPSNSAPKAAKKVPNVKETKTLFGKKKLEVEVTPLDQNPSTWTCPNCGKIMPKYVATCRCGETQPFEF